MRWSCQTQIKRLGLSNSRTSPAALLQGVMAALLIALVMRETYPKAGGTRPMPESANLSALVPEAATGA